MSAQKCTARTRSSRAIRDHAISTLYASMRVLETRKSATRLFSPTLRDARDPKLNPLAPLARLELFQEKLKISLSLSLSLSPHAKQLQPCLWYSVELLSCSLFPGGMRSFFLVALTWLTPLTLELTNVP